jgi:hypothetical protein
VAACGFGAANCFVNAAGERAPAGKPPIPAKAIVGRTHLENSPGVTTDVVEIIPHSDRNVTLARLATAVTGIDPIPLGTRPAEQGERLRVNGYGRTATEWVPSHLHSATFTVGAVSDSAFAIASETGDTCLGDAGGPTFREADGRLELIGLTDRSWQKGCYGNEGETQGGVQARTDDLAGWIHKTAVSPFSATSITQLSVAEFTRDGKLDVVAVEPALGTGALWVYPGGAAPGVLRDRIQLGSGGWAAMSEITVGKMNRDGHDDVLAIHKATGKLYLYPGAAAGGKLDPRIEIGSGGWQFMGELAVGEFTGDSFPDLVAANDKPNGNQPASGKLYVYPGTAQGKLGARIEIGSAGWQHMSQLAVGRFGPDQYDDVIASEDSTGKLWLYPGQAGGKLSTRTMIGSSGWNGMRDVMAADFNRDSHTDIAAVSISLGQLFLYPGKADGTTFASRTAFTGGSW